MKSAAITSQEGIAVPLALRRGLTRSALSWAMLECGRFPYSQLVSGIIFLPYFASVVVGDPVNGQADVANLGKIAGVLAALTAPFLGATIDHIGIRKPWLAGGTLIMAMLLSLLWWAEPNGRGLSVGAIIAILVCVKMLYAYTELLHNSMLVRAAAGSSISRVSSASFAIGYATALFTLLGFLYAFALPAKYDLPWLPDAPLFGLDAATYENVRIAGPVSGVALLVGLIPLLLFTQDHPKSELGLPHALGKGFAYVRSLPTVLRRYPNASLFIFARMIYADGTAAMTMFAGVLASGVMGWGIIELLCFGLVQLGFAFAGALTGGFLESRLESKRSVQTGLVSTILALSVMVGTKPSQVLFLWNDPLLMQPVWHIGIFETVPQIVFLISSGFAAFSAVVVATGSRSLLTKITPPSETGAFFGLYALASTATAWLAPLVIGYVTVRTGSQSWGFAPVVGFFLLGFALLWFVKQDRSSVEGEISANDARVPA